MPTIRLTDSTGVELEPVNVGLASTFARYLDGTPLDVIAANSAVQFLRQPLAAPAAKALVAGVSFNRDFTLGSSGAVLATKAAAPLVIRLLTSDDETVVDDEWFQTVDVPAGQTVVVLTFEPTASVASSVAAGPLGLGFAASGSITTRYAEPFAVTATGPTVAEAVAGLLSRHTLPGDFADLESLPVGALASVGGAGDLRISASVTLTTSANPLATASLPAGLGDVSVKAGGSLDVAVEARIAGSYELRIFKPTAGVVRLGYFRRRDAAWSAEVTAQVGAKAALGDRDLIETVLSAVTGKPAIDVKHFLDGGLPPEDIRAIRDVLEAGVDRTLTVAIEASFSSLTRREAAFEFELTLAALDATSRKAVEEALDGDLRLLQASELAGVAVKKSLEITLRERTMSLRVNLLGLVNASSVREFVRESRFAFDADSGELVIADTVSSRRLGLLSRASRVESERLRKVMLESFIATAAYRAGALDDNVGLAISQQHFEFHRKTDVRTMQDNLEAVVGVGLLSQRAMRQTLRPGVADYGPSTFLLEGTLAAGVTTAMFLDAAGTPRSRAEYEAIGRRALRAFAPSTGLEKFRRLIADDDDLWKRVREAGSHANVLRVLEQVLGSSPKAVVQANQVDVDATRILWWAAAMHDVAKALAAIRTFLTGKDPAAVRLDPAFQKLRTKLEGELADMASRNASLFGDPWGIVSMHLAAAGQSTVRTIVVSPLLSLSLPHA